MKKWIAILAAGGLLSACGQGPPPSADDRPLQVVATTGILGDLAEQVGGDRVDVHTLVPPGADPHTHELSLRDIRTIAHSQVAFSNYLMLEQHSVIKAIDSSLPAGASNVSLAEKGAAYGAQVIPLVENATLDTPWLGLRVRGTGAKHGADRSSEVELALVDMQGPGHMFGYVTGTFGEPVQYYNTADGIDGRDVARLPADAHTHMSWAFTEPGLYRATFRGLLKPSRDARPVELGRGELLIQVGQNPALVDDLAGRRTIQEGHADITLDLDANDMHLLVDLSGGGERTQERWELGDSVVWAAPKALQPIPPSPAFRFLGRPGNEIHQLPQAVLGAHVHGEIDPHLWLSVPNARAYVEAIRDTLTQQDPAGAETYERNTRAYLAELDKVDDYVAERISTIPEGRRQLITTHDAYGYLAKEYGLHIAGYVSPNPAVEPSVAARSKLSRTIKDLDVPAVFLEPTLATDTSVLAQVAKDAGVKLCKIYSDSFDSRVTSYVELMRFNADELATCLGKG